MWNECFYRGLSDARAGHGVTEAAADDGGKVGIQEPQRISKTPPPQKSDIAILSFCLGHSSSVVSAALL